MHDEPSLFAAQMVALESGSIYAVAMTTTEWKINQREHGLPCWKLCLFGSRRLRALF